MGHLQKLVSKNYILRRRCILLRRSYLYERPCKRAEDPRSLVVWSKAKVPRRGTLNTICVTSACIHSIPILNALSSVCTRPQKS